MITVHKMFSNKQAIGHSLEKSYDFNGFLTPAVLWQSILTNLVSQQAKYWHGSEADDRDQTSHQKPLSNLA
jgi:hypothetical protein